MSCLPMLVEIGYFNAHNLTLGVLSSAVGGDCSTGFDSIITLVYKIELFFFLSSKMYIHFSGPVLHADSKSVFSFLLGHFVIKI